MASKIDIIVQDYPDIEWLKTDGFDEAIVGVDLNSERLVYDIDLMIDILILEGMNDLDAIEHLEYNVLNAHIGEKTPIYINTI